LPLFERFCKKSGNRLTTIAFGCRSHLASIAVARAVPRNVPWMVAGALDPVHHGNRLCKTRKSRTVMILVPS
jgi:hypothetical protein